jgi:hypothetical protein
VPGAVVVLVKVCAIGVPLPAAEPVTPADADAVQEKVAPAVVLVIAMLVVWPEQIVCAAATETGAGSTVTRTVIGIPTQLPGAGPVGVTV